VPMQKRPILYSFRRCPYAMRARLAVLASGQTVSLREVLLRDKPVEMLNISAKGTVPVLLLPDGSIIDESVDVMEWALKQSDPQGWLSHIDKELISTNDGPFKQALDRYKYPTRYDLTDIDEPRAQGLRFLQQVDERLGNAVFLAGEKPAYTDYAIFPFIRQFSMVDPEWFAAQPLPNLKPWLSDLLRSEIFAAAMVRHPPWKAEDPEILFP
jgi:glutathione S-transferase